MKWKPTNPNCLESTPPGYTVTKSMTIRDGREVWLYQAIRLGSPSTVLCEAMDAGACKRACEADR